MKNNNIICNEDLVNNPNPRISICLCLDTSGSMIGQPIAELNKGVQLFYDAIRNDMIAAGVAEVAIVTFGGDKPQMHREFGSIQSQGNAPAFRAGSLTPMGEAVNLGLDKLAKRRQAYRKSGVEYYKPWLILMTDGINTGSSAEFARAQQRVANMCDSGSLDFLPIGIGDRVDMKALAGFSKKHTPYKLQGLRFQEFFAWLSRSVSRVSCSSPGQERALHSMPVGSWASL